MADPTTNFSWPLNPGDYVIAEINGPSMRILARTPNDIEAQTIISRCHAEGKVVQVFRSLGRI